MTKDMAKKQGRPAPAPRKVAAATKKNQAPSLDNRKAKAGGLFVLPFIVSFVVIYIPIVWDSIWFSFNEMTPNMSGYTLEFVGLKNYSDAIFVDSGYVQTLITGIKTLILNVPAIIIFSLFVAIVLNQKMVGRGIFRAILFLPVILCTGLVAKIDQSNALLSFMSSADGIMTGAVGGAAESAANDLFTMADFSFLFNNMAVGGELVHYITDLVNSIYSIINDAGVQILIFLAGLQSISPSIYESCSIDGASGWETFWKITFPMISPMILVNAIYTVIDSFTKSTNSVMSYISGIYNGSGGQVLSSAMSWMYFLLVMLMLGIVAAICSAFVFYQRRDS